MAKSKRRQAEENREPLISDWAGNERYACPVEGCAFDTLNREHFDEHMRWDHPLPGETAVSVMTNPEGEANGATDAH